MNIWAPLCFVVRGPYGPQRLCMGREGTVTPTRIKPLQNGSVALTTSVDSMQVRFLV